MKALGVCLVAAALCGCSFLKGASGRAIEASPAAPLAAALKKPPADTRDAVDEAIMVCEREERDRLASTHLRELARPTEAETRCDCHDKLVGRGTIAPYYRGKYCPKR